MIAVSALYSHNRADIDSGFKRYKELLENVLSSIPYLAPKKEDTSERDRAVEVFEEVYDEMKRLVDKLNHKGKDGIEKVDIESV